MEPTLGNLLKLSKTCLQRYSQRMIVNNKITDSHTGDNYGNENLVMKEHQVPTTKT